MINPTDSNSTTLPISSMVKMETVLSATLSDLHIRNEVGECVQSILLDVETTNHLQQQLELQTTQKLLENAQMEQQGVVLEAHTERIERYDRRLDIADHFVIELVKLDRDLKELLAWKEEHEYKVRNYDGVIANLAQTEEELKEAIRVSFGSEGKSRRVTMSVKDSDSIEREKDDIADVATTPETRIADSILDQTPKNVINTAETEGTTTTASISDGGADMINVNSVMQSPNDKLEVDTHKCSQPHTSTMQESVVLEENNGEDKKKTTAAAAVAVAVVSIDDEADIKEDIATLLTLDVEPLIEVFGFLDAMDILNTAQINMTMYNKVDNIFGISEDGQSPPTPTTAITSRDPTSKPAPTNNTKTIVPASATVTSTIRTTTNSSTQKSSSLGVVESPSSSGVMGKGLFSMLQPRPALSETTMSSTVPIKSSSVNSGQQQQPLNAKVAQSMASKLSDAELTAIISMTDKLSKLEKEVHMMRNEKEVFAAKLDGTEAVKQFLIGKVRDVEVKLNRSKEDEIKVTQQIASDQEVIAFLDSRVQELEQQTENLTVEKTGTQTEFDELKVSTSKKITMLSDMLKYEREKVREDEGEWKATKKVLVKEVKSCRAQILALQAERDGFKEQNDMLKRAIVSTGGGSNINKHIGGKKSSGSPTRRKNI
mmetsp:Transcript_53590/g.61870  ORF Transcript_53590/g.61870 Transcript_53590/m.61870 type:complete len:658 (+) Transcript_53590:333-2306(+)